MNIFDVVSHSVPASVRETTVQEGVNSVLLPNLLSGTEYNVQVTASYPAGQSEPLLVNAKTSKSPQYRHLVSVAECVAAYYLDN